MQKVILCNGFAILVWQNKKLKYPSNIIGIEQLFIEGLLCQDKQREDIGKQIMKKDRFSSILKILDEEGSVYVAQLAKKLNVSEVTIRSDLNILGMQGLLKRVHGGAKKAGDNLYKGNVQETVYRYAANKMAIAKAAYSLLEDGSTILVDDSSTCLYLIKQIKKNKEKSMYIYKFSLCGNRTAGNKACIHPYPWRGNFQESWFHVWEGRYGRVTGNPHGLLLLGGKWSFGG